MGIGGIANWAKKHVFQPIANKLGGKRSEEHLEAKGRAKSGNGTVLADGYRGGSQGKASNVRLT